MRASGALDPLFARLEAVRQDLARLRAPGDAPSAEASPQFLGIDLLARDILLQGACRSWAVPDADRRRAARERALPVLVTLAEQYAPPAISRPLLTQIRAEYHRLRNAVEHDGHLVSSAKCYEYLEAVESLAHSIAEPSLPDPPPNVLADLEGMNVVGAHELTRGVGGHPWYVVHGSREVRYGADHLLEWWRFEDDGWRRVVVQALGQANLVIVQKLQTRSPVEQELLAWRRFGESMGTMSYEVLGVQGEEIVRLLAREGISGAYVMPRGRAIEEHAGDRVIRYEWDGAAYVGHLVVRQSPALLDVVDIHYAVAEGRVQGCPEVSLALGQRLRLLRDDFEPTIVRQLFSGTGTIEATPDGFVAKACGVTTIDLIPNVYDWERALRMRVEVKEG